ncbi:MAG: hypothetical protein ACM3RX_03805 [Methanococcaceae archaeon]
MECYPKLDQKFKIHSRQKINDLITHSVNINAPLERIWLWLIQLGSGRAGWYSYDKIDNGGVPSACKLIPELQHIEVGDVMPAVPNTRDSFFLVREVDPFKPLILVVPIISESEEPDIFKRMKFPLRVSWTLHLEPLYNKSTKLISHGRISPDWLTYLSSDSPGKLFIERVYKLISKMPWPLMLLAAQFFDNSFTQNGS